MLLRTHLAVGIAVALYFLPFIEHKLIFFPVVLISSLLPDIDTGFSTIGRSRLFRPLQWFVKHRGIIHTYTVCIIISIVLAMFYPVYALPFFLGYSFHLYLDMFTPEGIRPFWPLKKRVEGNVKTGGTIDATIFYLFIFFYFSFFF